MDHHLPPFVNNEIFPFHNSCRSNHFSYCTGLSVKRIEASLALYTTPTCYICPELSRVFPDSDSDSSRQPNQCMNGSIDFYLNGSLRWGIELLVNGERIGEHMTRFEADGKYARLRVSDYAVVDLRCNQTRVPTNVTRHRKRVTVFFQNEDFSSCNCIFGNDEDIVSINLQN
jgi:hypothetical protein